LDNKVFVSTDARCNHENPLYSHVILTLSYNMADHFNEECNQCSYIHYFLSPIMLHSAVSGVRSQHS